MSQSSKNPHNPAEDPSSKARLRLWLRLLQSTRKIETELRERLRVNFSVTLPRFDVLAALYRKPEGMLMSELSRFLMVSNGNVTGIIDRLVADGMVARAQRDGDRRTSIVKLTNKGVLDFELMALAHEEWVSELLAEFSSKDAESLSTMLEGIRLGDERK
jgi:DNA-binding MarR family transcriptional regulator